MRRLYELLRAAIGRGVALHQIARESGVEYSNIYKYAHNPDVQVRTANLEKMARYFGVSVAHLRGEDEVATPMSPAQSELYRIVSGLSEQEVHALLGVARTLAGK